MALPQLFFIFICCFLQVKSDDISNVKLEQNQEFLSHISSVLNYLNSNPNKLYDYKKGTLIAAENKGDFVEISVEVAIDCINKYPDVPCNEHTLICHAFLGPSVEQEDSYQVLNDVKCSPKIEISIENVDEGRVYNPIVYGEQNLRESSKIELSNEAVSSEQGADFVAVRRENVPCLGCPFDVNTDAEGINELIDTALRHIESEGSQRQAVVNVKRLQQQVVAGVKYILLLEIAPTTCTKDADLSAPCPLNLSVDTSFCEIAFIEKPWISKTKHIISNNCTISQEYAPPENSRNTRDEMDNDILPNRGFNNPIPDSLPKKYLDTYDNIAESGNMEPEMDPTRLADLESQILFGEMVQTKPNIPKLDVSQLPRQSQRMPYPNFAQPEYVSVDESLPVTTDIENLKVEPLSIENKPTNRAPMFASIPVVDEEEPIVTIYDHQQDLEPELVASKTSEENMVTKDQTEHELFSLNDISLLRQLGLILSDPYPVPPEADKSTEDEKKVKRELKSESDSDSDSVSSFEENKKKQNIPKVETTTIQENLTVNIVKREVDHTSEESNSKESSEENKVAGAANTETKPNVTVTDYTPSKTKREIKDDNKESSSSSSSSSSEEKHIEKKSKLEIMKDDENGDDESEEDNKKGNIEQESRKQDIKRDSSSSSSSSSSEEDNGKKQRKQRSIGQLEKISSDEKVIVRDLADFAAATLDNIDDDHHKRVILQILGAKKLKLDGIYYQIILRLGISHCLEGEHNENCIEKLFTNLTKICKVQVHVEDDYSNPKVVKSQCQNIKKDENDRNRTNYSRYRRSLVGGHTPMSTHDSRVKEFVKATLTHLDSKSDGVNKHKSVEIVSATSQVVAGAKYVITAKIGLSDCKKTDAQPSESCELLKDSEPEVCIITIWDRPWLKKRQYTIKCSDKEYTFGATSDRKKRSIEDSREFFIGENLPNGVFLKKTSGRRQELLGADEDIPVIHPKAKEYVDMGLKYLSLKSVTNGHYTLKNIKQVSKRVVAGTLWHIEADVTICPKLNLPITTYSFCQGNSPTVDCQFSVLDQPWLVDGLQVNISCANDNNVYSFKPTIEYKKDEEMSREHDYNITMAFSEFMVQYKKVYRGRDEYNFRLKVFKDNLNTISLLNKYEKGTAKYGITQFVDMTRKEFSRSRGLRPDLRNENEIPVALAKIPDISLPKEFDWRSKDAVTEVKDQGGCGSCWAFSVTGNVEGQYAIKHGKLMEFSEQELVDCDKLDDGCNGGYMYNAYSAIEKLGGLEEEGVYPYEGDDEKCNFNKLKIAVELTGALNISHNETDMAKWLVQNGPISIGINANAMQFYMGGVSHPFKQLCSPKNLDHGVLIVGYGVDVNTFFNKTYPYWIVKNSWGPSWGEQGYYRVYRGDGTCGLNLMTSSAIVA